MAILQSGYTDASRTNASSRSTRLYRDIALSFETNAATKDVIVKKDVDAVKQSVKNLVLTNHYERPFKPSFGSNLRNRLFEPNDFQNRSLIKKDIVSEINALEPRVSNVSVVMRQLENEVSLTIEYASQGQADYNSVEFLVSRVRYNGNSKKFTNKCNRFRFWRYS